MSLLMQQTEPLACPVTAAFHSRALETAPFDLTTPRLADVCDKATPLAGIRDYHPDLAYQMAVVSSWAYSSGQVLADKLTLYGFPAGTHVEEMTVINDAMLVVARTYLIRSEDGRMGILAFRGTEPTNFINWLTNANTVPTRFGGGHVHTGFLTNLEALWSYVSTAVNRARRGASPATNGVKTEASTHPTPLQPLEHLYLTGHSLGGAMAVLAAAKIFGDQDFEVWRPLVKAIYTFGQPCVGDRAFATQCQERFGSRTYRHKYGRDVVPHLPPGTAGDFVHFGDNRVTLSEHQPWQHTTEPTEPLGSVGGAFLAVTASFLTRRLVGLQQFGCNWMSLFDDHLPQHYMLACKQSLAVQGSTSFRRPTPSRQYDADVPKSVT